MGHRANYAVREQGRVRFASDRHGGTFLPDLLFEGERAVRAFLDDEPSVTPERLYNEVWCEGLLLLDGDERVVLFDGVSELMFEGALRRVWAPLLQEVWAGWHLIHTPEPVRHLGEHLGLSADWIAEKAPGDPLALTPTAVLALRDPHFVNDWQTEIQWRAPDGAWASVVVDVAPLDVLHAGPALLDAVPEAMGVEGRDRLSPWGLLRIDGPERRLEVWTDVPVYRLDAETRARWPGWSVVLLSFAEAAARSRLGDRFFLTDAETDQAIAFLRERLDHEGHPPFEQAMRRSNARKPERRW